MRDDDHWISEDPRTKKLIIRFRVRGFAKQFYLNSGLQNNQTNLDIVRGRREIIQRDIALNRFDSTLESYKFGTPRIKEPVQKISLGQLWSKYLNFKSQQLELSTLQVDYKNITKIISELPSQSLNDAAKIRDYLLKQYSYHTAWKCLAAFSRCCKWGVDSEFIENNPFEKIQIPKPKKKSNEDEIKAYTLEQRDLIIAAFESHPIYSHHASLIKFLFWSGCRPGEAFALTWGDVSPDCTRITISKSFSSRAKVLKGTKNNKRRVFPCKSGSKLQSLLLAIRPDCVNPQSFLFTSKSGQRMNLRILEKSWKGYNLGKGYDYKGVVTRLAEKGKVPYLKIYSTRHTFATWAIASGASPEKVAYWLGDHVATVLKYYCHPDVSKAECPDF
jgi:integrase